MPSVASVVPLICPSILAADFGALSADVMDGHFVPNLSIGAPVVKSLRKHTDLPLDCHLMITDPKKYLPDYAAAGANGCTVHVEVGHTKELIEQMRDLGLRAGIVAQPDTPFESYAHLLGLVDVVLLMSVYAGFGGQKFIRDVLPKIEATANELRTIGSAAALQVDGGIDLHTAADAAHAGATAFVAGSAIFGKPNPLEAAAELRSVLTKAMIEREAAMK
jgi:ribulose-phosphate 3-epimerase